MKWGWIKDANDEMWRARTKTSIEAGKMAEVILLDKRGKAFPHPVKIHITEVLVDGSFRGQLLNTVNDK